MMTDSAQALRARMALCQPEHTLMGFFFEGLLEGVERLAGEETLREARAMTRGLAKLKSHQSCSALEYLSVLDLAARELERRGQGYASAVEQVAREASARVFSSAVGQLVLAIAGDDPHRGLSNVPGLAGATCTFGERDYERVSDTSARLTFRGDLLGPSWCTGLTLGGVSRGPTGQRFVAELESGAEPFTDFALVVRW
ncbi:TIGR02265 family protein [Corallococcus sp. M34]|nr:TIGR02265 family protein [Citreicoccus inhibens]